MRMMTALALIVASVPAAYAAGPLQNESFIEQVGSKNDATISQKNGNNDQATVQAGKGNSVITDQVSKLVGGKNTSGNVQVGKDNTASTGQTNSPPNPLFTTATFTNNSFSAQFGNENDVVVGQKGGKNNQDTLQAGDRNEAGTAQTDKSVSPARSARRRRTRSPTSPTVRSWARSASRISPRSISSTARIPRRRSRPVPRTTR